MESKKYKLLQDFGVLKKGDIISRRWKMYSGKCIDSDYYCRVIDNSYDYGFELHKKLVQNSPEWFAPYLFTTEDKVDIYTGDEYFTVFEKRFYDGEEYIESNTVYGEFKAQTCNNGFTKNVKLFSTKQAAEKYLESKFKVGDIVRSSCGIAVICNLWKNDNENVCTLQYSNESKCYTEVDKLLIATNEEIIKYYQDLGWVQGAKFVVKINKNLVATMKRIRFSTVNPKLLLVELTNENVYNIEECELIKEPENFVEVGQKWKHHNGNTYEIIEIANKESTKDEYPITIIYKGENGKIWSKTLNNFLSKMTKIEEPNYPKSWEDLKIKFPVGSTKLDKRIFATEKQFQSIIAFAQLSQLVAEMNGDWIADWSNLNQYKNTILREYDYIFKCTDTLIYHPLAFKSAELRDFSFEHHKELWNKYYQLS